MPNWIFDDATDIERDLLERIGPRPDDGADSTAYNVDIDLGASTGWLTDMTTTKGRRLDYTVTHPARLHSVDWDGWHLTFQMLDEDYEPTDEFFTVPDGDCTIHIS